LLRGCGDEKAAHGPTTLWVGRCKNSAAISEKGRIRKFAIE
jgi:hypothetical protein